MARAAASLASQRQPRHAPPTLGGAGRRRVQRPRRGAQRRPRPDGGHRRADALGRPGPGALRAPATHLAHPHRPGRHRLCHRGALHGPAHHHAPAQPDPRGAAPRTGRLWRRRAPPLQRRDRRAGAVVRDHAPGHPDPRRPDQPPGLRRRPHRPAQPRAVSPAPADGAAVWPPLHRADAGHGPLQARQRRAGPPLWRPPAAGRGRAPAHAGSEPPRRRTRPPERRRIRRAAARHQRRRGGPARPAHLARVRDAPHPRRPHCGPERGHRRGLRPRSWRRPRPAAQPRRNRHVRGQTPASRRGRLPPRPGLDQ